MTALHRPAESTEPTEAATVVRVTIAVPTFRRTDRLRSLLPLVLAEAGELTTASEGRCAADVVVVDNDPERGAEAVVAEFSGPALRYVSEPEPGIAAVRNRALDEAADSRLLAFIDDDERPDPQWLAHLVGTWRDTGAAAVVGRVRVEHDGELEPWIVSGGFFARPHLPTGTRLQVAATSNLLLDLASVREAGIRFDTSLGLSGGEDNLFTWSLSRAGALMVWCDEAVVADPLPPERATRSWLLMRIWSHGNTAVLTDLRLTTGLGARLVVRCRWGAGGVLRIGAGALRWCWGALTGSQRHRAQGMRALYRGGGIVGGACGLVFREYARGGRRWGLAGMGAR